MNERMRFDPEAERHAGHLEAAGLLIALRNAREGDSPAYDMVDAMAGIIGLAVEHRIEECHGRLHSFCEVIGKELQRTAALEAKCALLSASLRQAESELEPKFTDTEGGEL